jgi:hypothetical protein
MRLNMAVGLIIWVTIYFPAWSQKNNCEEQLNTATDEFNAGRFYNIPSMLKPCLDNGFSREQRERAYLLLTQTYLLIDDPVAAENSYMEVLRANPEFNTDPNRDPIEVVYLSKKFTADPIFSLYAQVGPSAAIARVIHDVDMATSIDPTNEKYVPRPTIHFQVGADWHFFNRFSLSSGLRYSALSFTFEETNKYTRDSEEMIEKQNWLSIPLALKFSDDKGRIRPYGFVGISADILLSDKGQFNIFNIEPDGISKDAESTSIDFMNKRNVFNQSFFLGGGAKLKYGLDYLFMEVRYSFGLTNVVNPKTIYSSGEINPDVLPYGHIDNYFRMDNLAISIGYIKPLYKPRKLKTARTKGLLKFIKKEE